MNMTGLKLSEKNTGLGKMISLTIKGQVPSGKNAQGIGTSGKKKWKYANPIFKSYRDSFSCQVVEQFHLTKWMLAERLNATIEVFQGDMRWRDVPGMMDAIWHCLEYTSVLADDKWIRQVVWIEKIDRENPRVCITLKVVGEK